MIATTQHCLLCENQRRNIEVGTYCGITNHKPKFENNCDIIKFGKILEEKILKNNVELALVKKTRTDTIGNLIVYSALGIGVAFWGVFLFNKHDLSLLNFTYKSYVLGASSGVFFIIGVRLTVNAIAPLNLYLRNHKMAKAQKLKLDEVLKVYNLTYSLDLSIKEKWPDNIEISKKLKIYPIRKKEKHLI